MQLETILIIVTFIIATVIIVSQISSIKNRSNSSEQINMLQQQIIELNKQIDDKLTETNRSLNDQLSKSNQTLTDQFKISQREMQESGRTIKSVTEALTKVEETNKQVKSFAEQLQSLENILRNPKQRGVLGEYYLEMVLKQVLPPETFKLQYKFKDNEIVDAIIFTKDGDIPVDAKYSLENYNRLVKAEDNESRQKYEKEFKKDLKKRIDETSKYIRPSENTVDFAFMFIPADGLYYEVLSQKIGNADIDQNGLIEYAFKKRVIIVTPSTFFAYLQTVLQGLNALKIEQSALEIKKHVMKLQRHLSTYEENMSRLGKQLGTTVNTYTSASNEFKKIDKDIIKITGMEPSLGESIPMIEKPGDN